MNKLILATLLAFTAVAAPAGELSLQLHGLSWHAESRDKYGYVGQEWNERNFGLGLRYEYSDTWGVQAGAYRNSVDKTTVYVAANYTPLHIGPVRGGVFAGLGSGYPKTAVLAGGVVMIGPVTLRVIPRIKGQTPFTVGIELGVPL